MTHYLMISNRAETACGLSNVPAVKAKELVSCPECFHRLQRWTSAHSAAKVAWMERVASLPSEARQP